MTAVPAAEVVAHRTGVESLSWKFGNWEDSRDFVLRTFPDANWKGVGYWNIPRVADIFYGVGAITYVPKHGKPLPTFA